MWRRGWWGGAPAACGQLVPGGSGSSNSRAVSSAPIPRPLPRREGGRAIVFLCKELRPLHPCGYTGSGIGVPGSWRNPEGGAPAVSALPRPRGKMGNRVIARTQDEPGTPEQASLRVSEAVRYAVPHPAQVQGAGAFSEPVPHGYRRRGAGGEAPGNAGYIPPEKHRNGRATRCRNKNQTVPRFFAFPLAFPTAICYNAP